MVLISYTDVPSSTKMTSNSVSFKEKIFLHGGNANDTVCIVFDQVQSPNWEIVNVSPRNLPVVRSGAHAFSDVLQFALKPGAQLVVGEVFPVFSECYLQSSPTHRIKTAMTVTV
jgi:hypothetical protein